MKLKTFLKEFTVSEDLVESDLDEICCDSLEASTVLRGIVERAFKLGVAAGLAGAECAIAGALKMSAGEMGHSGNPALQAVMQMSARCHRATTEPDRKSKVRPRRCTGMHKPGLVTAPQGALEHNQ
jgi:hypothetical protein